MKCARRPWLPSLRNVARDVEEKARCSQWQTIDRKAVPEFRLAEISRVEPKLSETDLDFRVEGCETCMPRSAKEQHLFNHTSTLDQSTTDLEMATSRVAPLWSTIWRTSETLNPALRSARAAQRIRAYHPARRRMQEHLPAQRYGTANEPPPHLTDLEGTKQESTQEQQSTKNQSSAAQSGEDAAKPEPKKDPTTVEGRVASQMIDPMLDSGESLPAQEAPESLSKLDDKPMESVLDTTPHPAPDYQAEQDDTHAEEHPDKTFDEHSPPVKAPHIDRPRYIHHFDTYGLVKRLIDGGWSEHQAITTMKSMRLMLADNTDLAKEALVSKSQMENEAYLFKAACAELKTEVMTRRKSEQEKMRTERTQLQHEVDILSQTFTQRSGALKEDLKGMFDDRKMAVRNEQRDMESKIQQLNYKITVMLQADAKSEVEGLRWLMTRRVILTLAAVVVMAIGGLKLIADAQGREAEDARRAKDVGAYGFADGERRVLPKEMVVKEGDNPAFVSLG